MVRTGVVRHPSEWRWSGYNEIQNQKQRYAIIDYRRLTELLEISSVEELKVAHAKWVEEALKVDRHKRDAKWSQSVAIGSEDYIKKIKKKLGMKAIYSDTKSSDGDFELRDKVSPYNADFDPQNDGLSEDNGYYWSTFN